MEYHEIELLLDLPAVRVLRGQNTPMVLGFLYRAFKRQLRVSISESELRVMLATYLEELREANPIAYPDSAGDYLNRWCDDSSGFLRKYYGEDKQEPLFELTSGSEKALLWLESLRQTGFVGTESRLQSILADLDEILKFATSDVDERILRLESEKSRLQAEIDRILATGTVETFTPVQINERFARVLATARELLGDFRLVEENFKRIARDIAERHALPGITKGAIVGHMLDAHDALRQSAQGQSFFAFWELLLSQEQQRRYDETLQKVLALGAVDEDLRKNNLLSQLVSHLLLEGEMVVDSHQRMSVNLRRVLDTANLQERRRVMDLIREIQHLALCVRDNPPTEEDFFTIEDFQDVFSSMSRQLWQAPETAVLAGFVENADTCIGLDDLRRFRNLPQIRLHEIRKNIESCLQSDQQVTLQHVIQIYPPTQGIMEVLGYLVVASEERRHYVAEELELVELPPPSVEHWRIPRVLFCKG